jgi:hypothetical protein
MALSYAPEAVRMLGQRYIDIYTHSIVMPRPKPDETDLRRVIAQTYVEVGQAMAALTEGDDLNRMAVEVEQAILWLQRAQKLVEQTKGATL